MCIVFRKIYMHLFQKISILNGYCICIYEHNDKDNETSWQFYKLTNYQIVNDRLSLGRFYLY